MPKKVKRKTVATVDDSAKKIRKEKIDPKTDCDEIEGQNSTVKRQINFATCMRCIKGGYNHPTKESTLYNTFESIFIHFAKKARKPVRKPVSGSVIQIEIGDEKGIPLFNLNVATFDAFHFLAEKGSRKNFRKSRNFICAIGINENEICQEICPNQYEFELLIEHQKNAHNVEYSAEFFEIHELDHNSSEFLSKPESDTVEKNPESDITVDESSEIDPVDSESDEEDQNSESDIEDKNNVLNVLNVLNNCVEKDNRIQTLQITEIKLKANVTSAQKALEKSKAESKMELEKVKNQLQTEVASKKSLEESLSKYRKLRQGWAVKVFQSDPDKEDLDNLLSLEPEKLFKKYEQISGPEAKDDVVPVFTHTEDCTLIRVYRVNGFDNIEVEVNTDTMEILTGKLALDKHLGQIGSNLSDYTVDALVTNGVLYKSSEKRINKNKEGTSRGTRKLEAAAVTSSSGNGNVEEFNDSNIVKVEEEVDVSTMKDKKLNLQILQRELYEKELDGIMDVLKMPSEDRVYTNILPMIKNLLEQVDTDHYTNAVENLINE